MAVVLWWGSAARLVGAEGSLIIPAEAETDLTFGSMFNRLSFKRSYQNPFEPSSIDRRMPSNFTDVREQAQTFEELKTVEHQSDIFSQLTGGFSGSYNWGTGELSGSLHALTASKNTKSSFIRFVNVYRATGYMELHEPKLLDDALIILRKDPLSFIATYGDYYVRSGRLGGRFLAKIEITSASDATRDEIQASLGLTSFSTDFSADMARLKTAKSTSYSSSIVMTSTGGPTTLPSLDELDTFAKNFPGEVDKKTVMPVMFYTATPIWLHSEVKKYLTPEQIEAIESRYALAETLSRLLRESELTLQDIEYVANRAGRELRAEIGRLDRELLENAATEYRLRLDWLRTQHSNLVGFSRLPDLKAVPPVPVLPIKISSVTIEPGDPALAFTVAGRNIDPRGDIAWPAKPLEGEADRNIEDGQIKFHVFLKYYHAQGDYAGPKVDLQFDSGWTHGRNLPPADYYILPNGESKEQEKIVTEPKGPNDQQVFWGRFVYGHCYRNGIHTLEITFNPVRVLCISFADTPPVIMKQPLSATSAADEPVALEVRALGRGALAYQWFLNGEPIKDATKPVLFLPKLTTESQGIYHAVVSTAGGMARTESATVTIKAP